MGAQEGSKSEEKTEEGAEGREDSGRTERPLETQPSAGLCADSLKCKVPVGTVWLLLR